MMSMCPIKNLEYYEDLAEEDYYTKGGEPSGVWYGKGAILLGLSGIVEKDDYKNIMSGFSPCGEALCQNPGPNHRAGFDLCFSPPKSVSVMWARADIQLKQKIQKAQFKAVCSAIDHLEKHAAITRRLQNGTSREEVIGLVAATYEHSTSRALDPQLHTHCLIANIAPRYDGSWGTLESRDLFLWQASAGAVYKAELAFQLRELGASIERYQDTFQINGVPLSLCEFFSKRSRDIREKLDSVGISSGKTSFGDIAVLDTRTKKQEVNRAALFDEWNRQMDERGFGVDALESILSREQGIAFPDAIFDEIEILEKVSEKKSVFRKQDIYRAAAEVAQISGESSNRIENTVERLLLDKDVIFIKKDSKHNELFTSRHIVEAEYRLISHAKQLKEKQGLPINPNSVEVTFNKLNVAGVCLSDEQKEAVWEACSPSKISILQGAAGSGKTASLEAVRMAHESEGYKVIGASVAKLAADNLSREAGLNTYTLARLLIDLELGRLNIDDKTLVLIDEAGQLGSIDLSALLENIAEYGAKVVLTGEDKQLDAVSHGGALRYLSKPDIAGTSRIETIRRQREQWSRIAVMYLRNGQAQKSLLLSKKRGYVEIGNDSADTRALLVDSWNRYRKDNPEKSAIVLAQTWKDVQSISEQLRSIYQSEGSVGNENLKFTCRVSDKSLRFEFSTGDRVRLTRNDYRRDFSNGTLATITNLVQLADGSVEFILVSDEGQTLRFSSNDYCDELGHLYLAHAYAVTIYSSQGITVDGDSFVLYNAGMDRSYAYVAGSRHKDNCRWFINKSNIEESFNDGKTLTNQQILSCLAQAMSRDNYKCLAIEYFSEEQAMLIESPQLISEVDLSL
ncbi:relaxase domain-containing protein [Vibrio parahaemolyticus]|uniref:MobF family relaxase n=1 Tax=Vibrio parahaemolyticus TaxID=670 RepID=UPI0022B5667F|nr:MobF family relaxase [Vibrio parahaemolyticus]MCZ5880130.1 relaxase domain-containing protein [Vibrio parahaemolyticus]MCZ6371568.1 relaxase domain-containing protein [Vibrio parahaemolyticus]